ncbi:MAG: D-tyrosyl-tRNA(Tyr) deacylase [Deltaproteobacteria bacterium]|nr:D-tyrosyl-tRNA(Tyr) deacylase [Deltaproteobacteria bacterium]
MRAVVQRVKTASVEINGRTVGKIDQGLLILLGIGEQDSKKDVEYMANKIMNLRIFSDNQDLMNLSLLDTEGSALVVSQFTLWGDCRKGRRPSFAKAARPENAKMLYEDFVKKLKDSNIPTETGKFQEMMDVHLINDGPVTLILDSDRIF